MLLLNIAIAIKRPTLWRNRCWVVRWCWLQLSRCTLCKPNQIDRGGGVVVVIGCIKDQWQGNVNSLRSIKLCANAGRAQHMVIEVCVSGVYCLECGRGVGMPVWGCGFIGIPMSQCVTAFWVKRQAGSLGYCYRLVNGRQVGDKLCKFTRQSGETLGKVVMFLE